MLVNKNGAKRRSLPLFNLTMKISRFCCVCVGGFFVFFFFNLKCFQIFTQITSKRNDKRHKCTCMLKEIAWTRPLSHTFQTYVDANNKLTDKLTELSVMTYSHWDFKSHGWFYFLSYSEVWRHWNDIKNTIEIVRKKRTSQRPMMAYQPIKCWSFHKDDGY